MGRKFCSYSSFDRHPGQFHRRRRFLGARRARRVAAAEIVAELADPYVSVLVRRAARRRENR